jgi:hypothetical protein
MEHKSTDFERAITVDESRFFQYYAHHSVWAASRDKLPHRINSEMTQKNA